MDRLLVLIVLENCCAIGVVVGAQARHQGRRALRPTRGINEDAAILLCRVCWLVRVELEELGPAFGHRRIEGLPDVFI